MNCLFCEKFLNKTQKKFCSRLCQNKYQASLLVNDIADFWNNVDVRANINLCWEWKGFRFKNNYGRFNINMQRFYTHRFAYQNYYKEIINNFVICHTCDNPPCCNPYHLFKGTHQDNVNDKVKKNRHLKGSDNGMSKLDEFDVKQILLLKGILKRRTVAEMYKVSQSLIQLIWNKKIWKHVQEDNK